MKTTSKGSDKTARMRRLIWGLLVAHTTLLEIPCRGSFTFHRETDFSTRAVAAYLKVVRRWKPSSAKGTRGGRARLVRGLWGLPRENFWILSASMCVFNGVLSVWEQILVVLVTMIFLLAWETECWTIFFQTVTCFFYFFSSACFFDIISSMSPQVLAEYF